MDIFFNGMKELLSLSNILYMNIGILLGAVFGAIPGLTVMLCLVLFLPFTYVLPPVASFMFLLGVYCAGSYGGSISAILIKTPGTPHAAATMLDGYPMTLQGKSKKALNVALISSTFGGIFSAFVLLFLSPQVAKLAQSMVTPDYFMICLFGLTIIAGVSGKSMLKGIISACIGILVSIVGLDPIDGLSRFSFSNIYLSSGFSLVVVLIGLFAICEAIDKVQSKVPIAKPVNTAVRKKENKLTKEDIKRIIKPGILASFIGVMVGIIPGTGAAIASFFSYDRAKNISKHKKEFGNGSIEGIAATETANNAVTGATLIPLLTLGIPGDAVVAIMLGSLMINGLTPGPNLFIDHGVTMYAIMIGLILINIFMFLQGKLLTNLFVKIVSVPVQILTPIIIVFCFAGVFSINNTTFSVSIAIIFAVVGYILKKLEFPIVPVLLGLVLGGLAEFNMRRALTISNGNWSIFVSTPLSIFFVVLITITVGMIIRNKIKESR